jgi:hypothetical protein
MVATASAGRKAARLKKRSIFLSMKLLPVHEINRTLRATLRHLYEIKCHLKARSR